MLGKGRLPGPQAREGRLGIHAVLSMHCLPSWRTSNKLTAGPMWPSAATLGRAGEGLEHPTEGRPPGDLQCPHCL